MRVIVSAIVFAAIGLAIGYGIYGQSDGQYIAFSRFFESKREGISGLVHKVSDKLDRVDEKRQQILVVGAVGGVVGLFYGGLTGKRRGKKSSR
jgi:hypothetical protein